MREKIICKNLIAMFAIVLIIVSSVFLGIYATENYTTLSKWLNNKLGVRQEQFDTFFRKEGSRKRSTDKVKRFED